ncbi:MAG TPA: thiamine phosphate synthase [Methylophilaceae bacterium]|nr:thiamine phosphate synthase [Methylophilaceae bacterium]
MLKIKGLYAVTPDLPDTALLLKQAKAALQGGVSVLQYRNKTASYELKREQASELMWLCEAHNVPFIINDHILLCVELDADGVHLGGTDGDIAAARRLLGARKIIGTSCYNRLDLAEQAKTQGADYVAFGACFDSGTKPATVRAHLELFAEARPLGLPTVAIGGITAENASLVIQAGADSIAVISALWTAPDIRQAAQTFSKLFTQD